MSPKDVLQPSRAMRNVRNAVLFVGGIAFVIAGLLGHSTGRHAVTIPAQPDADTSWQVVIGLGVTMLAIVDWRRGRR